MQVELPLAEMTLADKLEVMESLWADLSKRPKELPSPVWHHEVLAQRQQGVKNGELKFLDWDTAIAELRGELRAVKAS